MGGQLYHLLCRKEVQVAWTHEGLGEVNLSAAWAGAQGQCVWKESPRESGVSGLGPRTEFLFID